MRYFHAALAAMLITGCANNSEMVTEPTAAPSPPAAPQASVAEPPVEQPAAPPTVSSAPAGEMAAVAEPQAKGTDALMAGSATLNAGHQAADPLQCLMAWVQRNQKENPYLKTCEASPPNN